MSTLAQRLRTTVKPPAEHLEAQFPSLERQEQAAKLGMWIFLASEVLLFTGLFALYASYRADYTHVFRLAASHTSLAYGTAMTYVLVTSSFIVAMSIHTTRIGRIGWTKALLAIAILMGLLFLTLKGLEYREHFLEGIYPGPAYDFPELNTHGAAIFFTLYYLMTGLHALHVFGGSCMLAWLLWKTQRGDIGPGYYTALELGAMYWHLVDIFWLFLWPMFYLVRGG